MTDIQQKIDLHKVLVVIPTYNNETTIAKVISDVKEITDSILVVNDGSTDSTTAIINEVGVKHISYVKNKGKGYAIRQSFKYAKENGYRYVLTIDSDGQHYTSDIPSFINEIEHRPNTLIIGARNLTAENMPSKNTFANRFSNFWYRAETGYKLDDTQSGFRLYPIDKIGNKHFISNRYEFEVEVIVRTAWSGVEVCNIPIKVYYPPQEERVSHFRPLKDFTRISILNTFLVIIALLYYYPFKAIHALTKENIKLFIEKNITKNPEPNIRIASAIGLGIMFGIVPIWGYQMLAVVAIAHVCKLNKLIALVFSNISIPPMIPFILYGSFWTGAKILGNSTAISFSNISFERVSQDLFQYVIGACVLALVAGFAAMSISYVSLRIFNRKK